MRRSPMKMPSVQVMPTHLPVPRSTWAMNRVVVVLPLTPVTATMGIRPFSSVGKQEIDDRLADRAGRCPSKVRGASAGPGRR